MRKLDILRINLIAGLIAGAIITAGEILIGELYTRKAEKTLVEEVTAPPAPPTDDGSGE